MTLDVVGLRGQMPEWRHAFHLICVATVIALCLPGCNSSQSGPPSNRWSMHVFREVQYWTVPSTARDVTQRSADSASGCKSQSWEFDVASDGAEYRSWVVAMLQPNFDAVRLETSHLIFSRYQKGDSENVEIEIAPTATAVHVRVTADLYPD